MQSFIVTVYDRDRFDPRKRALREFEVVGSRDSAFRAAAQAAGSTPGAYSYNVERA
jgi:hypothetical protein